MSSSNTVSTSSAVGPLATATLHDQLLPTCYDSDTYLSIDTALESLSSLMKPLEALEKAQIEKPHLVNQVRTRSATLAKALGYTIGSDGNWTKAWSHTALSLGRRTSSGSGTKRRGRSTQVFTFGTCHERLQSVVWRLKPQNLCGEQQLRELTGNARIQLANATEPIEVIRALTQCLNDRLIGTKVSLSRLSQASRDRDVEGPTDVPETDGAKPRWHIELVGAWAQSKAVIDLAPRLMSILDANREAFIEYEVWGIATE